MKRAEMVARIRRRTEPWDLIVIGGGATGAAVAVDAAARGLATLLLEREDFGKATSSRSTKLAHGGVRYLEQGNLALVLAALRERGLLRHNAPHLVHDLAFLIPGYAWWNAPLYGAGLKLYGLLAGPYGFGGSRLLSREESLARIPGLRQEGLRGGVLYHDGQFDDARLLLHLIATAADHGAAVVNYCPVVDLLRAPDGSIQGVAAQDRATGERFRLPARVVVNATGIFADEVRRMADPLAEPVLTPSQGAHVVLDATFLGGQTALMVPRTLDGRVLFAIPWHGHTLVGTTDTPVGAPAYEPRPLPAEIDFILETARRYLSRPPRRQDVLSVFAGIRPLIGPGGTARPNTAALSRRHAVQIGESGLLTILGGKWTTCRAMAEDAVDRAIALGRLPRSQCRTRGLRLHGYQDGGDPDDSFCVYGSDRKAIRQLAAERPALDRRLHPALPYIAAEVVWAAREELALTVEDALVRRTRALFLNAQAAIEMAPETAALLAAELGREPGWAEAETSRFLALAEGYKLS